MGGFHQRNGGRGYRRARRLRSGKRAVVSVVGTLLALLVFFALFGIFLTQYLPLWMNENEAQLTALTQQSMANLKSNIDFQLAAQSPPVLATPFTMNSQGVPVLAQPTSAVVNFVPRLPGVFVNVSTSVGPGGGKAFFQNYSMGSLIISLPNRYYTPQLFEFEDDSVIQTQSPTQQIMLYPLTVQPNVNGNFTNLTMDLVQLYGNATQVVASGSQEVFSHFTFEQTSADSGTGVPFSVTLKIGTNYRCAWGSFFQTLLPKSGLPSSGWALNPNLASYCATTYTTPQVLTVTFTSVNVFHLVVAGITLVAGVGVE